MFASIHLWASTLNTPDVRPQPDADDCWHLSVAKKNQHGTVTITGTADELRAFAAALLEQVESIPEPMKAAA